MHLTRSALIVASVIGGGFANTEAHAAFTPTLLIRTANPIPGSGGVTMGLGVASHVAGPNSIGLSAIVNEPVVGSYTASIAWDRANGSFTMLSRKGMAAPGMPGATLSDGRVVYHGNTRVLTGTPLGAGFDGTTSALWMDVGSGYSLLATSGMPLYPDANYWVTKPYAGAIGNGRAAVMTQVQTMFPSSAIFEAGGASLTFLAHQGTVLTHNPDGRYVLDVEGVAIPAATGDLLVSFETNIGNELWRARNGQMQPVIGFSTPLPQTPDVNVLGMYGWATNEHGESVAFTRLRGTGQNIANNTALVVADLDGTRIIAREGSILPGTNIVSFDMAGDPIIRPSINASGTITFGTSGGIVVGNEQSWRRITGVGDVAPGTGGETFLYISSPVIDAAGNVVFEGGTSTIGKGLWAALTDGSVVPIVKNGDQLDIGGGNLRTVLSFALERGTPNSGQLTSLGADGLLCFDVKFTTNSAGTYYVQLPEPGIATATGWLACSMMLRRLPRRRGRAGAPNALARRA